MVGFLQIMIYLLAVYLVYKGFEIFQIAFVSDSRSASRAVGIGFGVLAIIGAIIVGAGAVYLSESMAAEMQKTDE